MFYDNLPLVGGGTENNADREYVEPGLTLRLGYELSPAIMPFIEAGYSSRIHKLTVDRNGLQRNSYGLSAKAGVAISMSDIWSGELALAYDYRNYNDPTLAAIGMLGLEGTLTWKPTKITTVTLTTATSIGEASAVGVSGVRNYDVTLEAQHKFRENLTGTLTGTLNWDRNVGAADDLALSAKAGFSYAFNRNVELTGSYQFTKFIAGVPTSSYIEHRLVSGLRFKL